MTIQNDSEKSLKVKEHVKEKKKTSNQDVIVVARS